MRNTSEIFRVTTAPVATAFVQGELVSGHMNGGIMQAGNHIDTYLEKIVAIVFALFHRFELLTQLPRLSKACVCVCTRERGWGGAQGQGTDVASERLGGRAGAGGREEQMNDPPGGPPLEDTCSRIARNSY